MFTFILQLFTYHAQPRDKNTLKTEEFTHALVVQGSKEPNFKEVCSIWNGFDGIKIPLSRVAGCNNARLYLQNGRSIYTPIGVPDIEASC